MSIIKSLIINQDRTCAPWFLSFSLPPQKTLPKIVHSVQVWWVFFQCRLVLVRWHRSEVALSCRRKNMSHGYIERNYKKWFWPNGFHIIIIIVYAKLYECVWSTTLWAIETLSWGVNLALLLLWNVQYTQPNTVQQQYFFMLMIMSALDHTELFVSSHGWLTVFNSVQSWSHAEHFISFLLRCLPLTFF